MPAKRDPARSIPSIVRNGGIRWIGGRRRRRAQRRIHGASTVRRELRRKLLQRRRQSRRHRRTACSASIGRVRCGRCNPPTGILRRTGHRNAATQGRPSHSANAARRGRRGRRRPRSARLLLRWLLLRQRRGGRIRERGRQRRRSLCVPERGIVGFLWLQRRQATRSTRGEDVLLLCMLRPARFTPL